MEKTISINLSGQNFQIEEDAYKKLFDYLESIKKHCGGGADSSEVIADIENSMAEKLKASLTPYKEVVTMAEIDSLIKIMGTVEDFDREVGGDEEKKDDDADDEEKDQSGASGDRIKRKLYRDTDNAVIAGVASGLGAYFDVDPVLFRIIFCVLIFAGGSAILLYVLLWIAMPEAKTAHQKLEMHGQAPTLAALKNLSKTGNKIKEGWKKTWEKRSVLGKIINLPILLINGIFTAIKKIWNFLWPVIKFFFGFVIIMASLSVFIGSGISSFYLLLQAQSNYSFRHIPVSELSSSIPFVWMLVTGFLSCALPAILAMIGGLMIILKKKIINLQTGIAIFGLWIIAGIAFSGLCLRYIPEIKEKIDSHPALQETTKTIEAENFTAVNADGRHVRIMIEPDSGARGQVVLTGRAVDLARVDLQKNDNDLNINENTTDEPYCLDCNFVPVIAKISSPSLEGFDVQNSYVEISPNFKKTLNIKADNSFVEWTNADAPALTAVVSDDSNMIVTGRVSSTTLTVDNARAHFDDFDGKTVSLTMKGAGADTDWKGKVGNFVVVSAKGEDSDGSVDTSALTVKTMTVDSRGALTIVSGPTAEIKTTYISDDSRLFYVGQPKISGDQKNKPIIRYEKIGAEEFAAAEDEDNEDVSLVSARNGKYFRLFRGETAKSLFKTLSDDFRNWFY